MVLVGHDTMQMGVLAIFLFKLKSKELQRLIETECWVTGGDATREEGTEVSRNYNTN